MKVNLKKILGLAALGLTLLSDSVPTWAGNVTQAEVKIGSYANGRYAIGSLVGARKAIDPQQSIGCSLYAYPLAVCQARTTNNSLSCYSYDMRLIASVQSMTDSSSIYFETRSGDSACYVIKVSDDSRGFK